MMIIAALELLNISSMIYRHTAEEIITNFLAVVIISDFDDYLFVTVSETFAGRLIYNKKIRVAHVPLHLKDLTEIEATTSKRHEKLPKGKKQVFDDVIDDDLRKGMKKLDGVDLNFKKLAKFMNAAMSEKS